MTDYMSTAEVATALGVSRVHVHQRAKARGIAPVRIGHACAWRRKDIAALREPMRRGPKPGKERA